MVVAYSLVGFHWGHPRLQAILAAYVGTTTLAFWILRLTEIST